MKRYHLSAFLESPVAIRRDRQSDRSGGVRSIAGTLLRGSLAQLYLQQKGVVDDTFRSLFLDENACRFGPLDPSPRVYPQTASACKRQRVDHGVVDLLWFRIAQHSLASDLPVDAEEPWRRCRKCGSDLKPLQGFWKKHQGQVDDVPDEHHSVAAHVGIDRVTMTAADSIFYTLESLDPHPEPLVGWIAAAEDVLDRLKTLLKEDHNTVYIGHHRTRGYGRVRLELKEQPQPCHGTGVSNSWDRWSQDLIAFLQRKPLGIANLDAERDFFFTVSLPTGAILLDELLRYSLDPASMSPELAPLPNPYDGLTSDQRPTRPVTGGGTLRCVAAVAKHERVRGWNAAHGLPRQDEWAVTRGSVYAYWFQGTRDQREAFQRELLRLSQEGLGVRRNEGFGVVTISDDFHRRFCKQEAST